jgi:hypothetical protein
VQKSEPTPILVTGSHRSGTTWVGRILSAVPGMVYISEPFHRHHRPGVCRADIDHWYPYITEANQSVFLSPVQEMLAFRYHWGAEIRALNSLRDIGRMLRDGASFMRGRFGRDARPLVKDPLAVLSTGWWIERFRAQAIVLVRHPAAVVSSLKRLAWKFSFRNFTEQPQLMEEFPEEIRRDVETAAANPPAHLDRWALLWKVIYDFVDRKHATWHGALVVRHEDLAGDPLVGFKRVCESMGLAYTMDVESNIQKLSSPEHPREAEAGRAFQLQRDSRGLVEVWRERLEPDEIKRVREWTEPVASRFYDEGDW